MTETEAFEQGRTDAAMHQAAIERYNHGPSYDPLPWPKGSPLYEAYHRGWKDWFDKTVWR